jgi:hypothetical protein
MGVLPRIEIGRQCISADGWEAEGALLTIRWGALVVEQFLGRIDRTFDEIANSEENHDIAK